MNQLERDGGVDRILDFGVDAAAGAIDQQDEKRTQALAARIDEVVADFADEGLVGV